MSPAEAQRYVNQAFQMYMNPTTTLQSGSTIDKWTTINAVQSGNINNPSAYFSGLLNNTATAYGWAGGSTIAMGAEQAALGLPSFRNLNLSNMGQAQSILNRINNMTSDGLEEYLENQQKNADDFNTTTDKWEKWMENSTKDIADIKTWLGKDAWDIAKYIVSGITAWIGASLLTKGVSAMAGKLITGGTGSGIAGAILGTLGPALGIGATVVGVGSAVNAIYSKMTNGEGDDNSRANATYREAKKNGATEEEAQALKAKEWLSSATTKHETASGALREQITDTKANGNWFQKSVGNTGRGMGLLFTASAQGIGQFFSRLGKKGTDLTATNFELFKDALDTKGVHNAEDREYQIISWLLLAYAATQDESNLKAVGVTKDMLKSYLGINS